MDPSAPLSPETLKIITTAYAHLLANKYHVLASTVMLCYDHIITFDDEVKYIWQRKKSFPFWLFLTFRYVTPIVSLINLISEHDPNWIGDTCKNWIWLPVAVGPIVSLATGIILILRVHAIYSQAAWVLWVTFPIYIGQLVVMGWSIPAGIPADLPPGFIGCIPHPKDATGLQLSSLYIAALTFDATIFALTLGRAVYYRLTGSLIPLITLVIRDGTLYFAVIFVVNLTNVFLLSLATPDLSAINAPFASMITAVLVARLMLNLRAAADTQVVSYGSYGSRSGHHTRPHVAFNKHHSTGTGTGAQTMSNFNAIGQTTTFLGRIGADEFAVPLPDTIFKSSQSDSDMSSEWLDDTTTVEEYQMGPPA
ncbi:hypothetical protein E1B28_013172 [Marasmius oreades]|uniref:DUF6533 domain-containing protein n=1 Tax=Marasmius oreades TaxID=181124 RepID=A0A9P7RP33_9AGAR|nr:uncharacterized protein E1B28_013172 [Marasmius oreades]KAG7087191.1 hypothetical protein E1B28_013172 [Marasmius oreades]